MKEKVLLKDLLFNQEKVTKLAKEIKGVYKDFQEKLFIKEILSEFPNLELKARIEHISTCLRNHLPEKYTEAVSIIVAALPPENDPKLTDNDFGDFIYAPYSLYVAKYGCTKENLKLSLNTIHEITRRFSSEDAIRYFLNSFPEETLKTLTKWTKDNNYHVRRLCSEGTRPKLPWSQKINLSASEALPILDVLYNDKTRFVTRSVANHLNDIAKVNQGLVIATLKRWKKEKKQTKEEMEFIIKHALRTLIKLGNKEALKLLGVGDRGDVTLSDFKVSREVKLDDYLEFSFSLLSKAGTDVIIDYILYFQNKNGVMNSKKVFKLGKTKLVKGEKRVFAKRHLMRSQMTTRTLYPGKHHLEIQVNGEVTHSSEFEILT